MTPYIKNQLIKLCDHPEWFNYMKLTITTLVIIEDTSDNCNELNLCYHSFQEDLNRAKSEIIAAVNGVYAPDRVFNTIEEIQEYFEYVHLESQEIKFIQTTTAIKDI